MVDLKKLVCQDEVVVGMHMKALHMKAYFVVVHADIGLFGHLLLATFAYHQACSGQYLDHSTKVGVLQQRSTHDAFISLFNCSDYHIN